MRISYITMQFPVPSETFASNDVRLVRERGEFVSVHGLKPPHRDMAALMAQRGLDGLRVRHNGLRETVRGLAAAVARPALLARTLAWLTRHTWRRPRHLAVSLMLLPRAFGILEELEREQPDVVHVSWGHYPALVARLVQQTMPGVVTSLSLAAYDLTQEYGPAGSVARCADFVRTLADYNVGHVASFTGVDPQRVVVIPDGVDVEAVERLAAGVQQRPRRIAVVSRLIAEKNVAAAIRIFAEVRREWGDATLAVLGDGPERENLEHLAGRLGVGDACEFLGHVSHRQVVEELARSDVLLFTSAKESERLPNAVKEGMLCGCVCIASETPGIYELLEPGVTGFVYTDERRAQEMIFATFAGRFDREELVAAARRRIRKDFNLHRTSEKYLELWEKAAVERRRARERLHAGPQAAMSGEGAR